jgi:hypothetical protein
MKCYDVGARYVSRIGISIRNQCNDISHITSMRYLGSVA